MAATVSRVFVEVNAKNNLSPEVNKMLESLTALDIKANYAAKSMLTALDNLRNPGRETARTMQILSELGATQSEIFKLLGTKAQETGSAFAVLGQHVTNFVKSPLATVQSGIASLTAAMGPVGVGIAAVGAAFVGAGVTVYHFAEQAAEAAEHIKNLSYSTGLTVMQVQALDRLGKERGLGELSSGIEKLNRQLGKEGGPFQKTLLSLGIGEKPGADAFYYIDQLREKFLAIEGEANRASVAAAALGKPLSWLLPIVLNTNEGFSEQIELLKQTYSLNESQIEQGLRVHESLNKIDRAWESLKKNVGTSSASIVENVAAMVSKAVPYLTLLANATLKAWFPTSTEAQKELKMLPAHGAGVVVKPGEGELVAQAKAVASAAAIASGSRPELVRFEMAVKEAEAQYAIQKAKQESFNFDEKALRNSALRLADAKEHLRIWTEFYRESEAGEIARLAEETAEKMRDQKQILDQITERGKEYADAMKSIKEDWKAVAKTQDAIDKAGKEAIGKFLDDEVKLGEKRNDIVVKNILDQAKKRETEELKVINNIRDAAGHIFDDLMTGSKNIWQDLFNTFKNIFLAPVRLAFQGLAQWLFTGKAPTGGILGALGGGGGGGGGWGGIFGGIKSIFAGSEAAAMPGAAISGTLGSMGVTGATGAAAGGLAKGSPMANALAAGAVIGGYSLAKAGYQEGGAKGAAMGAGGGALMGAGIGFMIGGPLGALGGAIYGAIAGGILGGVFGGGHKAYLEYERKRVAGIEAGMFTEPAAISRTTAFGVSGDLDVESDIKGRYRATKRQPIQVIFNGPVYGMDDFDRRVAESMVRGGSLIGDNIAYQAS